MLAFSSTGTIDFPEDSDAHAKVKQYHDEVAGKSSEKGDPAGNIAGSSVTNGPNQPKNFNFPKKDYGKQSRNFQSS